MRIQVINLERSPHRRAFMAEQLDAAGVDYAFFAAVDGKLVDIPALDLYDRPRRLAKFGVDLTPGEIGCYLSHWRILQQCLVEGGDRVLVLEDDAVLPPDFAEVVAAVAALPPEMELVRLSGGRSSKNMTCRSFPDGRRLVRLLEVTGGTAGYAVTPMGAKKILTLGRPMMMPIDMLLDSYWRHGAKCYAMLPYPVVAQGGFASDVGERRDVWKQAGMEHWKVKRRLNKLAEGVVKRLANVGIITEQLLAG